MSGVSDLGIPLAAKTHCKPGVLGSPRRPWVLLASLGAPGPPGSSWRPNALPWSPWRPWLLLGPLGPPWSSSVPLAWSGGGIHGESSGPKLGVASSGPELAGILCPGAWRGNPVAWSGGGIQWLGARGNPVAWVFWIFHDLPGSPWVSHGVPGSSGPPGSLWVSLRLRVSSGPPGPAIPPDSQWLVIVRLVMPSLPCTPLCFAWFHWVPLFFLSVRHVCQHCIVGMLGLP